MANELTTNDRAAGLRDLGWLAKNPSFWTIEAARIAGGEDPRAAAVAAEDRIRAELSPVPVDPAQRAAWVAALDERLRRLAVKAAPGMAPAATEEWRSVMPDVLSDLPALIVLTAAKRALHRPMQFLNQIEPILREISDDLIAARRVALNKLADFRRSLDAQAPAITDQTDRPLSPGEIRALKPEFRRIGLSQGWLTQAEIDAAHAEQAA
jgi:hypothetical protein